MKSWAEEELLNTQLPDKRLDRRLIKIVQLVYLSLAD